MKKAVVAGHICIDITPVFPSVHYENMTDVLVPGHLINMNGVNIHTGGAVANTGLAMRKFGCDARLLGKIGNDAFGGMICDVLEESGYDIGQGMIVEKGDRTSYSVVLAMPGIDRIFLHDPGANNTFCSDDVKEEYLEDAALLHFGYPPLMKRMYENEGEELVKLFKKAKEMGLATSLDMVAVDPSSDAGQQDWRKITEKVLPYVDFFVPSVEELCWMIDRERYENWTVRANGKDMTMCLDPQKDIKPLADDLLSMGAKVVMIKSGAPGMYFKTAGKEVLKNVGERADLDIKKWADCEWFEQSYVPERVLSGTGAGDTSIAAFLCAMLEKKNPEDCLHLAAAAGTSCVESYDALKGLKSLEELEEKIASGWKKQVFD